MKLVLVLFLLLLLPSGSGILWGQEKPNIIFFIADDVDKYQIGCFGGPVYTPNIDSLAAQGIMFNHAYVNSTVCTPSRYSLTTGRFAGRSRFAPYLADYPIGSQGLPSFDVGLEQDLMNVGHALQNQGYETGWVGKFHIGEDNTLNGLTNSEKNYLKTASSADPVATELFQKEENAFREYIMNKGFSWAKNIYEGNLEDPFDEHNLEWSIEAALEFIDSAGDNPFYLHLNTTLLHGPDGSWEQSLAYPNYTGAGLIDRELLAGMPPRSTINERITSNGFNLKDNPSGITWMDDGVGAIMRKLDSLGIRDNTLFVFLPDHGSANKASLFSKDGTNIPMIIRYPAEISPGNQSNSLVQALDMIPTFYELADVELPVEYKIDGKSLRPLFSDPTATIHESLYFELGCARAVMTEDYKYTAVRYPKDRIDDILKINDEDLKDKVMRKLIYLTGNVGISTRGIKYNPDHLSPDQLYKLSEDPAELNNLAEDPEYSEVVDSLKGILMGYLSGFEDRPFGEFIPGTNASPPDPQVQEYVRNIQSALRNGATLDGQVIICEGNCVTTPVSVQGSLRKPQASPVSRIIQDPTACTISFSKAVDVIHVYDLSGRIMLTEAVGAGNDFIMDKQTIPPGIHIISLRSQGRIHTMKIMIWE